MNEIEKSRSLLRRAGVSQLTVDEIPDEAVGYAIAAIADRISEPVHVDHQWTKDFLTLSGDHYVLTEEGWMPGWVNTHAHTGEEPLEVLDSVNARPLNTSQLEGLACVACGGHRGTQVPVPGRWELQSAQLFRCDVCETTPAEVEARVLASKECTA